MLSKTLAWSTKRQDFQETFSYTGKSGRRLRNFFVVSNQIALQRFLMELFCIAKRNPSNSCRDFVSVLFNKGVKKWFWWWRFAFSERKHSCSPWTLLPSFCWKTVSQTSRLQHVIWCSAVIDSLITNASSGVPLEFLTSIERKRTTVVHPLYPFFFCSSESPMQSLIKNLQRSEH